jgi:hypothetical protein
LVFNGWVSAARGPALAEEALRAVAGDRSFERGLGYVGAVTGLERAGDQVLATVRGARDYLVVLTLPDGRIARPGLRGECGCPYGQEGFFCKHCVAVGLAVARAVKVPRPRSARSPAGGTGAELSSWLASRTREELLGLVGQQLLEDEEWRRRLELRAAAASSDLAAVGARVAELLTPGDEPAAGREYGYLEGAAARRYGCRIAEVTEVVAALTSGGHTDAAAIIGEQALGAVADAARHASDQAGSIAAAAAELARQHRRACLAGQPDPLRLAAFLAGRLVSGDAVPVIALNDYASVLGAAGLARLRELVMATWERGSAGGPCQDALIAVLTTAGDVDGLVRVLSASQDAQGHSFLRIAAELDMAGRPADALAWAERGLREASKPSADLARYVTERYCEQGRAADAEGVLRDWFASDRSAAGYRQLRELAGLTGCWPSVRPWALEVLRERARQPALPGRARRGPAIVDALIDDGDFEAAWREARGVASERQWLELADSVALDRPADALAVYRRQIDALRKRSGGAASERIARLLESARDCCERLGNLAEFESYLRAVRDDQKRRPKLIRALDAHQL